MILDEPTASIDAAPEYKIFNELYRSVKNKTPIIILHKGNIVEQGSHKELIAQGGLYAKSFALQAKGYN